MRIICMSAFINRISRKLMEEKMMGDPYVPRATEEEISTNTVIN